MKLSVSKVIGMVAALSPRTAKRLQMKMALNAVPKIPMRVIKRLRLVLSVHARAVVTYGNSTFTVFTPHGHESKIKSGHKQIQHLHSTREKI